MCHIRTCAHSRQTIHKTHGVVLWVMSSSYGDADATQMYVTTSWKCNFAQIIVGPCRNTNKKKYIYMICGNDGKCVASAGIRCRWQDVDVFYPHWRASEKIVKYRRRLILFLWNWAGDVDIDTDPYWLKPGAAALGKSGARRFIVCAEHLTVLGAHTYEKFRMHDYCVDKWRFCTF